MDAAIHGSVPSGLEGTDLMCAYQHVVVLNKVTKHMKDASAGGQISNVFYVSVLFKIDNPSPTCNSDSLPMLKKVAITASGMEAKDSILVTNMIIC
jgi:hypothetical protein